MKERILLAPGLNGNELYGSLALHGVNCIGLRICGAAELARMALMRSGVPVMESFLNTEEETAVMAEALRGDPYFRRPSYSDVERIAACIRRMRSLVPEGEEGPELERTMSRGAFAGKNAALLRVYRRYAQALADRKALDALALIRKAVRESSVVSARFLALKEFPLTPLETALLDRVSGGAYVCTSLSALFCAEEKGLSVKSMKNCYGAENEVETILEDVYVGKRLDRCTVAVTDSACAQLFFDCALRYDIPMTFGCGIPIANANPARLAALYIQWMTDGFFGAESAAALLKSEAFDGEGFFRRVFGEEGEPDRGLFFEMLCSLRFTNDADGNERLLTQLRESLELESALYGENSKETRLIRRKLNCIPFLGKAGKELALPAEEFLTRYARIRREEATETGRMLTDLDLSAAAAVRSRLEAVRCCAPELSAAEALLPVLRMRVGAKRNEAGKLHVTTVEGAFSSLRGVLYIAGLSASRFPGIPGEDPLLLDADLELFGEGGGAFRADERVLQKKERLLSLVRLASALGTEVNVSYAGINAAELKKDNPSSLLFELYREEHGAEATAEDLEKNIQRIGYFDPALSPSRLVGKAYVGGMELKTEEAAPKTGQSVNCAADRAWSPSALDVFFDCPRRFMLRYLLEIPEPEEADPFEVLPAADGGTLAHSLMEVLGGTEMPADEFRKLSEDAFDRFVRQHPPLIPENVPVIKEEFLEMMETAFGMEPHREVVLEEENISCTHESGIRIHGYPDRVEKLDDGSVLVVDFKTGRRIGHIEDDIGTCLQVVLYAYILERTGCRVSGGEYRYIRSGKTVSCRFDEGIREQLNERLTFFRESLEKGSFPPADKAAGGDAPCRWCGYAHVCGRSDDEGTVV